MSLMNKTGIYIIFNHITEDYYIGSASVKFCNRQRQHKCELKYNRHRSIYLQRAYNKYGSNNFTFSILEVVEDQSNIIPREQWYLDNWKPRYNIAKIADNSAKGRKMSEEHKQRLREINLGRPAWNRGIPFAEESRKLMSLAKKGKRPPNYGKKGERLKPLMRSDGKLFDNPTKAAIELDVKPNTIVKSISDKTRVRTVKGYTFKYIDNEEKE